MAEHEKWGETLSNTVPKKRKPPPNGKPSSHDANDGKTPDREPPCKKPNLTHQNMAMSNGSGPIKGSTTVAEQPEIAENEGCIPSLDWDAAIRRATARISHNLEDQEHAHLFDTLHNFSEVSDSPTWKELDLIVESLYKQYLHKRQYPDETVMDKIVCMFIVMKAIAPEFELDKKHIESYLMPHDSPCWLRWVVHEVKALRFTEPPPPYEAMLELQQQEVRIPKWNDHSLRVEPSKTVMKTKKINDGYPRTHARGSVFI